MSNSKDQPWDEAKDLSTGEGEESGSDGQVSGEVGGAEKRRRVDSGSSASLPQQMCDGGRNQLHESVAASPPRFMNLDDIMKMANGVTDLTLAHEIAVNDDFRLETTKHSAESLEGRIGHVVSQAFWDVLEEKLRTQPDDHSYSIKLLEDVKSSLLELLLPQHVRLRAQIEAVLDLSLIEQKAEHGGVDFQYYADYVIGVMSMLCAPIRDEQISALRTETNILTLYKQISEVLGQMKLDMVNFTISQLRPILKQHSAEYERNKFNSLLSTQNDNGVDGLEFTRHWLRRHYEKCRSASQNKCMSTGGTGLQTYVSSSTAASNSSVIQAAAENPGTVAAAAVNPASVAASSVDAAAAVHPAAVTSPMTVAEESAAADTAAAAGLTLSSHTTTGAAEGSGADCKAGEVIQTKTVVNSAYVELLDWDAGRVYPETMLVDMKRLVELQDRVVTLTLVASVLAVTYSTVGTLLRDLEEFKVTLKKHVMIIVSSGNSASYSSSVGAGPEKSGGQSVGEQQSRSMDDIMSNVAEQVSLVACDSLQQHGFHTPTTEQLRVLKGQICALAQHNNPIRRVMKSRVCGFISSVLTAQAGVKAVQIPAGFTAVQDELSRVCESFVRLISYNYSVYEQHYQQLLQQLSTANNAATQGIAAEATN